MGECHYSKNRRAEALAHVTTPKGGRRKTAQEPTSEVVRGHDLEGKGKGGGTRHDSKEKGDGVLSQPRGGQVA
jgi:hypothetical protein